MLSIAEISGVIAAAVMGVQIIFPLALVIILIKYIGTENSAVSWTVINRTIGSTVWPHLLQADAVTARQLPSRVFYPSWSLTIVAGLLILTGVLTPLGLYEEIVPGDLKTVDFEYVRDSGPWGRVTMPRPNAQFARHCEWGLIINCPGQYQGVYMQETQPGHYESQNTDETSTINVTIPSNLTEMFTSATSDKGNTVSGLFDIQYRRWKWVQDGIINGGQPVVEGDSRYIGSLITQDKILLVEGLIVDMRDNPGIGFRNHTIPMGLGHGGNWSEDITWIEPVTRCADTNLSIELRLEDSVESFTDNSTFYVVDRGAFRGLDLTTLESPPWIDNQTLDLFGRAHKAAQMHNVLVASSLNVSLPIDETAGGIVPKIMVKDTGSASPYMFSQSHFDEILMDNLRGVGGPNPLIPDLSANSSSTNSSSANSSVPNLSTPPYVNRYPDGFKKLLALNYSAITQICRGYYELESTNNDWRGNNITYPAVQCGIVLGAPQMPDTALSISTYKNVTTYQKNLYMCATGIRASIKTVDFRYNGTGAKLENLEALNIKDKSYPDAKSEPLWAAEHSYDKVMRFDPLWGIVDDRYESLGYKDGFYTLRAAKLWLPTSPFLTTNFGETGGYDSLAAVSGFLKRLGNLYYSGLSSTPDYTGQFDFTMLERFQRLSSNETAASSIPSLILTDGLAAGLVGTKTSISSKYVQFPASLAVDDIAQGNPRARVLVYKRVVKYDLRYAIPGFITLGLLLIALIWSLAILITSRSVLKQLQNTYNQTSAGRLATNLLLPDHGNPKQPSSKWVTGDGSMILSFGHMQSPEKDHFCSVVGEASDTKTIDEKSALTGEERSTSISVTPTRHLD